MSESRDQAPIDPHRCPDGQVHDMQPTARRVGMIRVFECRRCDYEEERDVS